LEFRIQQFPVTRLETCLPLLSQKGPQSDWQSFKYIFTIYFIAKDVDVEMTF